ncbi:MAG: hypothetical protein U0487_03540 [Patescibacteria group bacterium]
MSMLERFDREGFWLSLWLAVSAIAVALWPDQAASLSMCFIGVILVAYSAGKRLLPAASQLIGMFAVFGTIIGVQSLLLAIGYYLSIPLEHRTLSWATIVACGITAYAASFKQDTDTAAPIAPITLKSRIAGLFGLGIAGILASFVFRNALIHATDASIRSPWPYLHPILPVCLGVLFLMPFIISAFTNRHRFLAPMAYMAVILTALITPMVYTHGFGFDGFLHRESERLLYVQGTLQPKPFYYIGQYVLTVWIAHIFELPIAGIDHYLLPSIASLFVAAFAAHRGKRLLARDFLVFTLIPLSWLITTTPQSLAYLFGFMALLLHPRNEEETQSMYLSWVFALWSLFTHPLAGLPFGIVIMGMGIIHRFPLQWRRWMAWLIGAASAFAVPLAFFVFSILGKQAISWDFAKLLDTSALLNVAKTFFNNGANASLWPDWVDLVELLLPVAAFIFAMIGIQNKEQREEQRHLALLAISGSLLYLSGYLMRVVDDLFLIAYERANYADRLFTIGLILLALPAAKGLYQTLKKPRPPLLQAALIVLLVLWQSAHAYAAFPRQDAGEISHGWSVGRADTEAVKWIDQDAGKTDYAVLANQSMSAAAVESLGFKRYAGDVFFYPIPTGGDLYQLFLRVSSADPSLDQIKEAAKLAKAKSVYVAIHRYWWDAERVREQLKTLANNEQSFNDGEITVYRFDLE